MANKVSIGPTTYAGWGTAALALIGAIVTYLTGDHTAKSVTAMEVAAFGFASFAITQGFRYLQANKILPQGGVPPSTEEELNSSAPVPPPIPDELLQVN